MIRELLLIHHSHTDIGYTHPQPIVFELHDRFIEKALDLADATAGEREDARFRWTCEITGPTRSWWERASNSERDRFLAAIWRGQFEVAALQWHLTPLADVRMLVRSLENVRFFRDLGVPIRSAMNTDVNGVPWGLIDVLLDHGVDGFSMAINSHLGGPPSPRPGAFRWVSPTGRELVVWNGFQYWHAANVLMGMPQSIETVEKSMPPVLAEAERRGYPLAYLPLQITNPHHPDNAAPDATLTGFVKAWNDRNPEVRLRTVLLSEVFERLRKEPLPTMSGDWTDYWNLGAGSSIRETTVLMEGMRVLSAASELSAWPGESERREREHLDAAHENLALYAEHTWGADCSITAPQSIETRMQWALKSAYAYQGMAHARIGLRDGLHKLAQAAGGEAPTYLLYNPLGVPVNATVRLPVEGLEWPLTPGVHHLHRLDGALAGIGDEYRRWCRVELPALGYRAIPVAELPFASSEGLALEGETIASNRVRMAFDSVAGGVRSLTVDGVEYAGTTRDFRFGVPVLERPSGGSRREIMQLDFSQFEPADGWQKDWARDTFSGKLLASESRAEPGAVQHVQTFEMENGDRVGVTYRLFADDPSVDVEVVIDSAGDDRPYSLALPFVLPEAGETTWHFDTAGALVEFDREQLPDVAQHYVTAGSFVRMQTETATLSVATPDLPLWKFGGMFFAPTNQLDRSARQATMLAWLANNYWEVNFLANQTGRTVTRYRLLPHAPEPAAASYFRARPYTFPLRVHAYREMGPVHQADGVLLDIAGEGVDLTSIDKVEEGVRLVLENVRSEAVEVTLAPAALSWTGASLAKLDGTPIQPLSRSESGVWAVAVPPRAVVGVVLQGAG